MTSYNKHIIAMIKDNSSVLDLGCGNGELLTRLQEEKNVSGRGIEITEYNIQACINKGISVLHADLNAGLKEHKNNSYDYVILNRTLQIMQYPDKLLIEMLRVGKKAIVNFLNFGFYKNRWQLMFKGIMPVTQAIPYKWFSTPNIHFCTRKDFHYLCKELKIRIVEERYTRQGKTTNTLFPNLFTTEVCCLLEKSLSNID